MNYITEKEIYDLIKEKFPKSVIFLSIYDNGFDFIKCLTDDDFEKYLKNIQFVNYKERIEIDEDSMSFCWDHGSHSEVLKFFNRETFNVCKLKL